MAVGVPLMVSVSLKLQPRTYLVEALELHPAVPCRRRAGPQRPRFASGAGRHRGMPNLVAPRRRRSSAVARTAPRSAERAR